MALSRVGMPMVEESYSDCLHALRQRGVLPRHIRTLALELEDHRLELLQELRNEGYSPEEADAEAQRRLGCRHNLVRLFDAHDELKSDRHRKPWFFFAIVPACTWLLSYTLATAMVVSALAMSNGWRDKAGLLLESASVIALGMSWCVPFLIAAIACFDAAKWRVHSTWPVVGVLLIAALSGITQLGVLETANEAALTLGVGLNWSLAGTALAKVTAALVLIVAPYLWGPTEQGRALLGR
jgi:hypothetical protein